MGRRNYKYSAAKGDCAENAFDKAAKCKDSGLIYIREASKHENLYEHWDKLYYLDGDETRIEIKSTKRFNRYSKVQYDYVLLELHGVDNLNNNGWLFGGHADYLAFELDGWFLLFKRTDLIDFVKEKTGIESASQSIESISRMLSPTYKDSPHYKNVVEYQIYHRRAKDSMDDLFDAFIWVPIEDLKSLKHFTLPK